MRLFKRNEELKAELENSIQEVHEAKKKGKKIEELRTDLQAHLKDNNFGPRLYQQMVQNWK